MHAYIEILRPFNCVMAAVAVVLGGVVAGASGPFLLVAAFVAFLLTGAGMAVNDYFDYKIDRVNRPKRPIPSGRITRNGAVAYAATLFAVGIGLTFTLNYWLTALAAFNSLLNVAYSWKLKRMPLLGNLSVAWMVGTTYVFGALITGELFSALLLGYMAFLSNFAREVYKSVTDVKGDKKHGARTVAVAWGPARAKRLGDALTVVAAATGFLPYVLGVLGGIFLGFQIVASALYLTSLRKKGDAAGQAQKRAMLVGLLGIAADLSF